MGKNGKKLKLFRATLQTMRQAIRKALVKFTYKFIVVKKLF